MKKYLFISLFFLFCFIFVSQYLLRKNRDIQADKNTLLSQLQERFRKDSKEKDEYIAQLEKKLEQKNNQEKVYTIVVGGDLMLDRGVKATIKKLRKDYHFPFEKIAPYLHSADYVFANLEGSLSDLGSDQGGKVFISF